MPKVECRSCPWAGIRDGATRLEVPCPKCGARVQTPQRLNKRRDAVAKADLQRYGIVSDPQH